LVHGRIVLNPPPTAGKPVIPLTSTTGRVRVFLRLGMKDQLDNVRFMLAAGR